MMLQKRWVIQFFLSIIFLVITVGLFNFIVDPYGLYRVVDVKGFNQQKEGVRTSIRYVKALEIALIKPKTIIMGSSRVHDGVNPNSIKLENYHPVYNYGFEMARIKEIKYYLQHAIKNSEVKNLIFGIDFFMFNKFERLNSTFDSEIVKKDVTFIDVYFKPLLSMSSVLNSYRSIKSSVAYPERREFLSNGYRPGKHVFYGLKDYGKLHNYTNWTFLSSKSSATLYYSKMATDEETFQDFEEILKICKVNNINVKLYISPAHANLDGEGLLAAGLYKELEDWKRSISSITSDFEVPLYDFSGYNLVTTEEVITPMNNYWDSSHFKEKIGDIILDRVLNVDNKHNFGVLISPSNIESHLMQIRRDQKKYQASNVEVIKNLRGMFKDALSGLKQDKSMVQGIF